MKQIPKIVLYQVGAGFWFKNDTTELFANIAYVINNFDEAKRFPSVPKFLKNTIIHKNTTQVLGKTRYKKLN